MKTRKQVLAEFQRMHRQLCGTVKGFVTIQEYNQDGSNYWRISLSITEFADGDIVAKHEVDWRNYSSHATADERENEAKLAEFKEKFNLK